jgi:kojibiose phosphorylase
VSDRFDMPADVWVVEESGFDRERANFHETLFTVGNGRLGTRGSLEEGHLGALSGTFLAGVYDGHDVPVIDLVNCPDWVDTTIFVGGVRLDVDTCTVVTHRRSLDLRDGLLTRSTVFEDVEGRRTRLETIRCASMADRRVCVLRVEVTPENHAAEIRVETGINGDRRNLERLPLYPEGTVFPAEIRWEKWARARHLEESSRSGEGEGLYLEMRTIDTGIHLGYIAAMTYEPQPGRLTVLQRSGRVTEETVHVGAPGQTLRMDKLVAICTSRDRTSGDPVRSPGPWVSGAGPCSPNTARAGSTRWWPRAARCGGACGTSATARSSAMSPTPAPCDSASIT